MPTPTTTKSTAPLTLTEVGRVRAVLARLGELANVYRGRTRQPAGLHPIA